MLTCGAATHQERTLTFCSCADLETEGEVSEPLVSEQQCENTCATLTRCVSSAGTLKLQELDVDLEILLLSFLTVILQEKQYQQTRTSQTKMET